MIFNNFLKRKKENNINNENNKIDEKKEEKLSENIDTKVIDKKLISETIDKNYKIIEKVLELDPKSLVELKDILQEDKHKELIKKINDFIEIISNIKNYNEKSLNNLVLEIKTAKEIFGDNNAENGCILDLMEDIDLPNNVRKNINKILYYNLENIDDLTIFIDDDVIKHNAQIMGVKEEDFKRMMEEDQEGVINRLLSKLINNGVYGLKDLITNDVDKNKDEKDITKHVDNKLIKIIALSTILIIGANNSVFAEENTKKVDFNKTEIDFATIFSQKASREDINKVEDTFKNIFKDQKIVKYLSKKDIIENLGWIKEVLLKIKDEELINNIIDRLDNNKKIAYKEFILFTNAREYCLQNNEEAKNDLLKYMGEMISEINQLKSIKEPKDTIVDINDQQIRETENKILSIKNLITDKIYSTSNTIMGKLYNEIETIKYISSYGIKADRDYVYELYKQLRQEEANLSKLKK